MIYTYTQRDEIEELQNKVYNLTLYLSWVEKKDPELFELMIDRFSGMPGYSAPKEMKEKGVMIKDLTNEQLKEMIRFCNDIEQKSCAICPANDICSSEAYYYDSLQQVPTWMLKTMFKRMQKETEE